uniref:O-methyltransferase domain-containing protein n=1 Tax=Setaria italica TaxID=4555 RepID=K3ZJ86_SETIT
MGTIHNEEDQVCLQAQELMFAYNNSLVLRAAIQLGLLDALCAAPTALTAGELAEQIKAADKAEATASVDRILVYLACFNVVRCSTEMTGLGGAVRRRYTPAPLCRWLTKNDGKGSLGPFAVFLGDPDHVLPWHHIADTVVSGDPSSPFERTQGMPFFDYLGKNQRLGTMFDHAMAEHSVILVTKMVEYFRGFDDVRQLVDVGGVEHVAGNMYESVPFGDAVLLQWILLMQTDEQCLKILKNCYKALPEGGKVIVIDGLLPETPDAKSPAARDAFTLDMCMFVLFKGKERTEREFTKLARESGFTGAVRTTYIFLNFYAIEFTK